MKKVYVMFVVLFSILLLTPFTVQTVVDFCSDSGEPRLLSFDIFKDSFYAPFKRESSMTEYAQKLKEAWRQARENVAAGAISKDESEGLSFAQNLEPVVGALSDLEAVVLAVNTYAQLDSSDDDVRLLRHADTLLNVLEDEPERFQELDSCLKLVTERLGNYSVLRALSSVKNYGAWKGSYLRAFEKTVEDENAVVLAIRPKYQLAVWNLFSDPGEKVVLGSDPSSESDSWLFYRQDVEFLVQPSPLDDRADKLDNPVKAIEVFRDQLKAKGVELLVVVVPGKPSIYPERLTGNDDVKPVMANGDYRGHGKMILDTLTALGFNTVDLYTPLWAAKADDERLGALYLNDDTHWTPRGAELAAREISTKVQQMVNANLVEIGPESMDYVASDSVADRMGDIGEMSGLNKFDVFKVQKVVGHVVTQQIVSERVIPRDSAAVDSSVADSASAAAQDSVAYDTSRIAFKDDFRKAKILILGDSFSRIYQTDSPVNAGWIAHFAKNMKRPVASIVSDGGASTLVREKLARKAGVLKGKKLLIWEFVERDLRFGAEGWKTVELN